MKSTLIAIAVSLLSVSAFAQSVLWEARLGGTRPDELYGCRATPDGGFILAGTSGSFDPQFIPRAYLVKTAADGQQEWFRTFGNATAVGRAVQPTSDGGYALAGYIRENGAPDHDAYLVKTDAQGNLLWERAYDGGDDERAHGLIQTSDGGYLLVGQTYQLEVTFANYDVYAVKTDALGNVEWARMYQYSAVGADSGADVMLAVLELPGGDFVMGGFTQSQLWDAFLLRVNALGDVQWARNYGGASADECYALCLTSDGHLSFTGVAVTGNGDTDALLTKIDLQGDVLWSQTYGSSGGFQAEDQGRALCELLDGGFAIAGHTSSIGAGGWDAYLVRTNAQGEQLWEAAYGGNADDRAHALVATSDGDLIACGWTSLNTAGFWDGWLARLDDESLADCNANGVPDLLDLQLGTSVDCNKNMVPDECDIAGGTSSDVNSNGVPDECECATPTNYCVAAPNSAGPGALMAYSGVPSVSGNNFWLLADGLPAGQFGLFYYGPTQTQVPFGNGVRCVTGTLFRLNPPAQSDSFGSAERRLDFNAPPANEGAGQILAGSTWNFQFWYRDPMGGGAGFNLSDGLELHFCQ